MFICGYSVRKTKKKASFGIRKKALAKKLSANPGSEEYLCGKKIKMMYPIVRDTRFELPGCISKYQGKVRDVYNIDHYYLVLAASDRVSAFDHVFSECVPFKGQILSRLAYFFFKNIPFPHHVLAFPAPDVTIVLKTEIYPIEFIVRGYLCGHAARLYQKGARTVCGVPLPDGLKENDQLPEPILTPTTKSVIGHDIDITEAEIIKSGLCEAEEFAKVKYTAIELYKYGAEYARTKGLILADTKFEFGVKDFELYVADEIFTPDSSRYFIAEGFEERQLKNEPQPQYSKEFLRKWLLEQGYSGQENAEPPKLSEEIILQMSDRYIEVYEKLTGETFERQALSLSETEERVRAALEVVKEKYG